MFTYKGFTLIEILISLSIVAITSILTIPNLNNFLIKLRVENEIDAMYRLLFVTRNAAINNGNKVTLCPLVKNQCINDWSKDLTVFIDQDNNKKLDAIDTIITTKSAITQDDQLVYGKLRNSIIYGPDGYLSGLSNGTFRYCPKQHDELSRGIVLAISGRLYKSTYNKKSKRDENRRGEIISCK